MTRDVIKAEFGRRVNALGQEPPRWRFLARLRWNRMRDDITQWLVESCIKAAAEEWEQMHGARVN